jgi:hypothetical protein
MKLHSSTSPAFNGTYFYNHTVAKGGRITLVRGEGIRITARKCPITVFTDFKPKSAIEYLYCLNPCFNVKETSNG